MNPKRRWSQVVAFAILGVSAACLPGCDGGGNSKVMGSIEVAPGEHTGDVSTVNGSIRIRENASVGSAHTVNGSIDLAQQTKVSGQAQSVNGNALVVKGRYGKAVRYARIDFEPGAFASEQLV